MKANGSFGSFSANGLGAAKAFYENVPGLKVQGDGMELRL